MKNIGGLLAAGLFSLCLAGVPAKAHNQKLGEEKATNKVAAGVSQVFVITSEAKAVKEIKYEWKKGGKREKKAFKDMTHLATKAKAGEWKSGINKPDKLKKQHEG